MSTQCFFLNATNQVQERLRRYHTGSDSKCSNNYYHDHSVIIGQREARSDDITGDRHPHNDSRWPTHCHCGYEFTDTDQWQYQVLPLYQRMDTHEVFTLREAPVGAMWYSHWMEDDEDNCGPDGHCLTVRLPGNHDWMIDSRANNCGSPCLNCGVPFRNHPQYCKPETTRLRYVDSNPEHRCWIRHGTVPNIHVDKNGNTCDAGGGSISVPGYHGFLHHGMLTDG